MPLEIRELKIKVNIEAPHSQKLTTPEIQLVMSDIKEEMIERCVEQVLQKIEKSFER